MEYQDPQYRPTEIQTSWQSLVDTNQYLIEPKSPPGPAYLKLNKGKTDQLARYAEDETLVIPDPNLVPTRRLLSRLNGEIIHDAVLLSTLHLQLQPPPDVTEKRARLVQYQRNLLHDLGPLSPTTKPKDLARIRHLLKDKRLCHNSNVFENSPGHRSKTFALITKKALSYTLHNHPYFGQKPFDSFSDFSEDNVLPFNNPDALIEAWKNTSQSQQILEQGPRILAYIYELFGNLNPETKLFLETRFHALLHDYRITWSSRPDAFTVEAIDGITVITIYDVKTGLPPTDLSPKQQQARRISLGANAHLVARFDPEKIKPGTSLGIYTNLQTYPPKIQIVQREIYFGLIDENGDPYVEKFEDWEPDWNDPNAASHLKAGFMVFTNEIQNQGDRLAQLLVQLT